MQELLPFEKTERKVIVRKKAETCPEYGCRPEERPVSELINYGIINLNKPAGPTSHQVSDYVQKILEIDKSGHSGTLDPKVTGVLPIALGTATRIVQALLNTGKEYVCLMYLHKDVRESRVHEVTKEFTGKIKQIPPIKSAVKRQERTREIYYLNIREINGREVLFRVGCEAGTYIRKLVHQIGAKLGSGAHMAQLIRTKAGPFKNKDWISLHDLKDAYEFYKQGDEKALKKTILPVEKAVEHLPKVWVVDSCVDSLCHGANLSVPGIAKLNDAKKGEVVAIMTLKGELISLGTMLMDAGDIMANEKGLAVRSSKVFMERGIYPKFVKNEPAEV